MVQHRFARSGVIGIILAVFIGAGAASAGYVRVNEAHPDDPMGVAIFELENGLRVYLSEYHEEPRFYAEIAVRAGSKHDPPETTGLAHYFEHLMFKGSTQLGTLDYEKEKVHLDRIRDLYEAHFKESDSEKRAALYQKIDAEAQLAAQYAVPNEFDRVYTAMGATDINAHTWLEETVYKVNLPANRLAQWARIEADRFSDPVFRLFPTELETVYEEKNRSLDNKHRIIHEAVNRLLYKKHPYGQETVLGRPEHLKSPSINNIRNFFNTWYAPNNMGIFISGDIDIDETIAVIDAAFSSLKRRDLPEAPTWAEPAIEGREYTETRYEGEEYALIAFRTVPHSHPDAEALLLVDMILDNATAGLINLNLNQAQRVRQSGSFPMQLNDYGAQYFYGVPKEGQSLEEVEQLLLEQIALVREGKFEDWIIPAIINDFKKTMKAGLEENAARVSMMARSFIGFSPWEKTITQIQRMERLKKKDVLRVAHKYFGDGYVVGYRKDAPHEVLDVEKPPITKIAIDPNRESAFAKSVLAMPVSPMTPDYLEAGKDYEKASDPKGRDIYYAANPVNDLFNFSYIIDFGSHQDNTIAIATRLLEKSGAGDLSAEALKKEWYKLGTDFGIASAENETTITLSGLDEHFEDSLVLLARLLREAHAEAGTLDVLKQIILAQRADAKKQAESIASALVNYNRYGEESPYLRLLPKEELIKVEEADLYRRIEGLLDYKHAISYSGSLPLKKVARILKKRLPLKKELEDPPPYHVQKARRPQESEIYLFHKESAQSHIRLEFGSGDYEERLTPVTKLYNEYFSGGMAGIVFQELREARALAYVAGARYLSGYRKADEYLMVGVIQTQPDKSIEAVEAFVELLDTLPESPPRFALAKQSILSRYRTTKTGFREAPGAVRSWERHGLEGDPRPTRFEGIEAATLADLVAFQQSTLKGRPKLISIVGDTSKMDRARLNALGAVREIPLEKLFID